jgi:hypothetical protein
MDPLTGFEDDDAFFRSGEAPLGSLAPVEVELELELESAAGAVTPEQLARAGRFRRPVALIVAGLGILSLFALATHHDRSPTLASGRAREPAAASLVSAPMNDLALAAAPAQPLIAEAPTPPEPALRASADAPSSTASTATSSTASTVKRGPLPLREPPVSAPVAASSGVPLRMLPSSARFPDLPR